MAFTGNQTQLFLGAVENVLNNWTALQLAIQHELGGPQSKEIGQWMIGTVAEFFYGNKDLQNWEVGDYLADILSNEFNTECEDGSLEEVGANLCRFYQLCRDNKESEVCQLLQTMPKCDLTLCQASIPQETPPSLAAPPPEVPHSKPEPDEDGWTVVSKKK